MDGRATFAMVFLGQLLWGTEAGAKDFERLLTETGPPRPDGSRRPRDGRPLKTPALAAHRAPS